MKVALRFMTPITQPKTDMDIVSRRTPKQAPLREGGGKYPAGHIQGGEHANLNGFCAFCILNFRIMILLAQTVSLRALPPARSIKHRTRSPLPEGGSESSLALF